MGGGEKGGEKNRDEKNWCTAVRLGQKVSNFFLSLLDSQIKKIVN